MNREQMIEKAARVIFDATPAGTTRAREAAAKVLDAILPQVSTVEELEALPAGSLLSVDGVVYRWRLSVDLLQAVTESPLDYEVGEILGPDPLTVVWRPES